MQDSCYHQLLTKQHVLLRATGAVAGRFCGPLPHHNQLQHQLHHLLRCGVKLQKRFGLIV